MWRVFATVLGRNGGGAIINVLSVASFFTNPAMGSYSASKAAAWALTNGVRVELRRQGTLVVGVHSGYIDTDMASGVTAAKASPEHVAALTLDAVQTGREEVLADERTRALRRRSPMTSRRFTPASSRRGTPRSAESPGSPRGTRRGASRRGSTGHSWISHRSVNDHAIRLWHRKCDPVTVGDLALLRRRQS
jgi:NAD(P)-dependent dehydrogenase (short-subunit alcohol dehydrogenase family)